MIREPYFPELDERGLATELPDYDRADYAPGAEIAFLWTDDIVEPNPPEPHDYPPFSDRKWYTRARLKIGYLALHRTDLVRNINASRGVYCIDSFVDYIEERRKERLERKAYLDELYGDHPLRKTVGALVLLHNIAVDSKDNLKEQLKPVINGGFENAGELDPDESIWAWGKRFFKGAKSSMWISYERLPDETWWHWWMHASRDGNRKVNGYPVCLKAEQPFTYVNVLDEDDQTEVE